MQSVKAWLLKLVFGLDPEEIRALRDDFEVLVDDTVVVFNSIRNHNELIKKDLNTIREQIQILAENDQALAEMSGGEGWPETIQNAIMNLDNRLEEQKQVLVRHQYNFDQIITEIEIEMPTSTKKDLN
jgi:hypothetical protein